MVNSLKTAFSTLKHKIFGVCIGMVLAWLLLYSLASSPPASPVLSVSFLASTNDAAGVQYTALMLSNSGPQSLFRICSYRIIGPSGKRGDTIKNAPLGVNYKDHVLRPGESETITIPTPIGEKVWRAGFDCWTYGGKIQSIAEDLLMTGRRTLGLKVRDPHLWGLGVSEVITE